MEEILRQILEELKYQTKLLTGIYEFFDEGRAGGAERNVTMKKQYQHMIDTLLNHPIIAGQPELKSLFEGFRIGGM